MSKLELENRIFARAFAVHAAVDACNGALVSASEDLELQTLLHVYNAQFLEENQHNFCPPDETLQAWQLYRAQRACLPQTLGALGGVQEFNFELALLEEK
ncbi:MAG: hypothetical protein J6Y25_04120 [Elusimicrobiaceae bacterium]|nr:hypothetical protein [Elusimicrobiaceae bacterium]MBP5616179.1 hypothetical protein [Elusimicrobiaceae bacterium]